MILQELDVHIHYRPGKANSDADALSCGAISTPSNDLTVPLTLLAVIQTDSQPAKEGEETLSDQQLANPQIEEVMKFVEDGIPPNNDQRAKELILTWNHYRVIDSILYHIKPDKTLQVVLPTVDRKSVFTEAHSGILGAHSGILGAHL